MNLMHISKLHLQIILGHQIGLPHVREAHSYQILDLMDHLSWNNTTMSLTWKFEHSHQKLKSIIKLPFSMSVQECHFMSPCLWAWVCSWMHKNIPNIFHSCQRVYSLINNVDVEEYFLTHTNIHPCHQQIHVA